MPTPRTNISIEELKTVLDKTGLPFDSAFAMKQAQPGARAAIGGQFGTANAANANKGIMAQLAKIAEMDQKLSGTYGDPTSNLYIENPVAREQATYGRRGTEMSQVNDLARTRDNAVQDRENNISSAEGLYSDLTTAQSQAEAEQKRVVADTKKRQTAAAVKQGTIKDEKGNTVFELSKQQTRQARNSKVNLKDAKAVSEFFNKSTPAFRSYLEDEGLDGKIKGDNLTAKQIKDLRDKFTKEQNKKSVATAKEKADLKKGSKSHKALF